MHPGTLAVWGSRVGRTAADEKLRVMPEAVRFLPVRVAQDSAAEFPAGPGEIEVVLTNGRRVRIRGTFQSEQVARLLDIAERGGSC